MRRYPATEREMLDALNRGMSALLDVADAKGIHVVADINGQNAQGLYFALHPLDWTMRRTQGISSVLYRGAGGYYLPPPSQFAVTIERDLLLPLGLCVRGIGYSSDGGGVGEIWIGVSVPKDAREYRDAKIGAITLEIDNLDTRNNLQKRQDLYRRLHNIQALQWIEG
jgi:hypothetical protein